VYRIGFLITARLKSTRLPLKILKDLSGKPVIERIIDRVKEIEHISEIILCTSSNPQDKPLIDIALNSGIYYFNGHEDDVLNRLLTAANLFSLDYIMGITADNPLFSIRYSDIIADEAFKGQFDFIKVEGLPFGSATYAIRTDALRTVCQIKTIIDTEIWGYLINRPEVFNIKTLHAEGILNRPELRFTLDYEEDYQFINGLYSRIPFQRVIDLYDIMNYLDLHPELTNINSDCIQLDLDEKTKEQIDLYYRNNLDEILTIKQEIYSRGK